MGYLPCSQLIPKILIKTIRLIRNLNSIEGGISHDSTLNPLNHKGCQSTQDIQSPVQICLVTDPADISSASTIVESILRPWSPVEVNQDFETDLITPAQSS